MSKGQRMTLALLAITILVAAAVAIFPARADLNSVDPYATGGWYEVVCSETDCIRYNPRTGESWILACPGASKSCAWDPIEVRTP